MRHTLSGATFKGGPKNSVMIFLLHNILMQYFKITKINAKTYDEQNITHEETKQ